MQMYMNIMATGSLNKRRTNMECIRFDPKSKIGMNFPGTLVEVAYNLATIETVAADKKAKTYCANNTFDPASV